MPIDNSRVLISPSIIAADLSRMAEIVSGFDPEAIDLLHMDVMDGIFVPNLTFGPGYISDLSKNTSIPMDVHLMIEKPENSVEQYLRTKPWCVTIHYESTRFPARILSMIRDAGSYAGISINPGTPVDVLYDLAEYFDMALIMSVDPGFYGQKFMPAAVGRIEKLKAFLDKSGSRAVIQVDGGITADNIGAVVKAGAVVVVAGSAVFKEGDANAGARKLKGICS